jgi:hypothetical protein
MGTKLSGMHIVVLIIITVLTAAFIFATAYAFFPEPEYNDFCSDGRSYPMKNPVENCPVNAFESEEMNCMQQGGFLDYTYDNETGCVISVACNMCYKNMENARKSAQNNRFYVLAALSVLLIIISLYAIKDNTPLLFAITTGIILGSLISIIIMSFITLDAFSRYLRPVIFFLQILLVVLVAVKKFSNTVEPVNKKKGDLKK